MLPRPKHPTTIATNSNQSLVNEYPNVFLNTFCTQAGRKRARELIEAGQTARIYEEEAVWKEIIRTNVLFNFVQQLKHIDVLAAGTGSHSEAISEYDSDAKPWLLREDGVEVGRVVWSVRSGMS